MDFKTRFQGKMSHISKDGAFDHAIMSINKMVPIGKSGVQTNGMMTPMDSNPMGSQHESVKDQYNQFASAVGGSDSKPPVQRVQAQKPAAPSLKDPFS